MSARGRFITFEGGEGAGKSTQVKALVAALETAGKRPLATREPGGSPGAEEIRALLVSGATSRWDGMTEALLHMAARRDHLVKTVWPALADGRWVVSDRFADSTFAYQGAGQGLARDVLQSLHRATVGDFAPDLTLVLDLPVDVGLARAKARGGDDRYERMGADFHNRLRQAFLSIASADPKRCAVINANADPDRVGKHIRETVAGRFGGELGW